MMNLLTEEVKTTQYPECDYVEAFADKIQIQCSKNGTESILVQVEDGNLVEKKRFTGKFFIEYTGTLIGDKQYVELFDNSFELKTGLHKAEK